MAPVQICSEGVRIVEKYTIEYIAVRKTHPIRSFFIGVLEVIEFVLLCVAVLILAFLAVVVVMGGFTVLWIGLMAILAPLLKPFGFS